MNEPQLDAASASDDDVVVVGVDGSEGGQAALLWAAGEARRRGCVLEVLHAWIAPGGGAEAAEIARRSASAAKTIYPDLEVRTNTPQAEPALALIEASSTSALMVVGPRGLGGFRELLLGSVSHQCIQHAACPVVVVRARRSGKAGASGVVVGVDGSHGSDLALRWALAEGRYRQTPVRAVYAWQYPPVGAYAVGPPDGYQSIAREIVEESRAKARQWAPDVPVETAARFGAPVQVLLDEGERADMLVIGSRGRGGFRGLLLGSVGNEAAHYASCPVVVVRPGAFDGELEEEVVRESAAAGA